MAKDNLGLLQEIVGQLRMLNKSSVRDRLREAEEAKRAEALAGSTEVQTQQQDQIIDGATDFQRRFLAGQAKTFTDKKLQDTGSKLEYQKKILEQNEITAKALTAMNEGTDKFRANAARTAAETRREGKKGVGRGNAEGSKATQFKKGWNKQIPPGENWLQTLTKLIPILATWAVGSLVIGIKDFVYGYDESGLSGGIAGLLGGADTGGFANAVRNAFKGAGYGMIIGGVFGGLPGAIIGGLIGMGVGALLGWIGAEKIENWIDVNIKSPWKQMTNYFRAKHREISRWIFTPPVGGPHGHGGIFFGSELAYKIRFFSDWSGLWDDISDWFAKKYDALSAWIFTAPTDDAKGKLFGSELLFDLRFWKTDDGKWNDTFVKIGNKFGEWGDAAGEWLYSVDGTKVKLFGGWATMPTWTSVKTTFKEGWDDFWDMIFSIPRNLMEMIKGLFPERVREWLGWEDNLPYTGTSVGQYAATAMANPGMSIAEMADLTGYTKTRADLGLGVMVNQSKVNQTMENLLQYGKVGSPLWTELTGINLQMATANQLAATQSAKPLVVDASNSNNTEVKIFHSQEKVVFGVYPPSMLPTSPAMWHPNGSLAQ
jgi:hypothetical protein